MSEFNPLLPDPVTEAFGDVERTSNGTTGPYTLGFDFPNKANVTIGGTASVRNSSYVAVFVETSSGGNYEEVAYTFASTNTITLATAPTAALKIRIKRITLVNESTDAFTGNSALDANSLNDLRNKTIWMGQELYARQVAADAKLDSAIMGEAPITPVIPSGSIDTAELADGAVTLPKVDFSASGTNGQALMKRAGVGAFSTITAADVSGFDTQVRTNRLDQMTAPTADVAMNSQKITGLATGTTSNDAVNKAQMDAAITAAVPSSIANLKISSGNLTVNSTSYQVVTLGWQADMIVLYFDFTATYPADADHIKPYTQTCVHINALDGLTVRTLYILDTIYSSGTTYSTLSITFQQTATGFQIKKASAGNPNYTLRWAAFKNYP